MVKTTASPDDTVIIREPGGAEINWRTRRMMSLGADAEFAAKIADSDADVHDIERLLKAGCAATQGGVRAQPAAGSARQRIRELAATRSLSARTFPLEIPDCGHTD